jgi:hypothetical protein
MVIQKGRYFGSSEGPFVPKVTIQVIATLNVTVGAQYSAHCSASEETLIFWSDVVNDYPPHRSRKKKESGFAHSSGVISFQPQHNFVSNDDELASRCDLG